MKLKLNLSEAEAKFLQKCVSIQRDNLYDALYKGKPIPEDEKRTHTELADELETAFDVTDEITQAIAQVKGRGDR